MIFRAKAPKITWQINKIVGKFRYLQRMVKPRCLALFLPLKTGEMQQGAKSLLHNKTTHLVLRKVKKSVYVVFCEGGKKGRLLCIGYLLRISSFLPF